MKKRGAICGLLCLILMLSMLPVTASAEPEAQDGQPAVSSVADGSYSVDAKNAILGSSQRVENAKAAFVYEVNSGTLMYAWNPDTSMEPASFVKIMTALLAVENGSMTDVVTVGKNAVDSLPDGAVSADLVADEVLTLKDLLECMMVGSANDAAVVIAEHIGGSQEAFVEMMNQRAKQIGCTGTQFTNPHGLSNPQQCTTARDTARILLEAIQNDLFLEIFSTVNYTVPATNKSDERYLVTGNYLMSQSDIQIHYDPRVIGGRTGIADDATRCIAALSEAGDMRLVSVIMGSVSTMQEDGYKVDNFGGYRETKALLDICFNDYKTVHILYPGQVLSQHSVVNGGNDVTLGSETAVATVLPASVTLDQLSFRYADVADGFNAPIKKGDKLSELSVWYGNLCLAQADLYAMNGVRYADPLVISRENRSISWWVILLAAFGVIVIAVCGVLALRYYRILSARRRSRRHRADRRRSR